MLGTSDSPKIKANNSYAGISVRHHAMSVNTYTVTSVITFVYVSFDVSLCSHVDFLLLLCIVLKYLSV